MNPLNHHFDRSRFFRSLDRPTCERTATRKKLGDPMIAASGWVGMGGRRPAAAARLDGRSLSPAVFSFARTLILYRRRRRLGRSGSDARRRWARSSSSSSSRMQPRCKKRGRWHADVSRGKEAEWVGSQSRRVPGT